MSWRGSAMCSMIPLVTVFSISMSGIWCVCSLLRTDRRSVVWPTSSCAQQQERERESLSIEWFWRCTLSSVFLDINGVFLNQHTILAVECVWEIKWHNLILAQLIPLSRIGIGQIIHRLYLYSVPVLFTIFNVLSYALFYSWWLYANMQLKSSPMYIGSPCRFWMSAYLLCM